MDIKSDKKNENKKWTETNIEMKHMPKVGFFSSDCVVLDSIVSLQ